MASSKGFGAGALPETASNAAFALAAALPLGDFALVALTLVGFVAFPVIALIAAFTETFFSAFVPTTFLAILFFAMVLVAFPLEEVFFTFVFLDCGGFWGLAVVLRLFVVFFAIDNFFAGTFFAFSLVGDMGGIIFGIGWLDKV